MKRPDLNKIDLNEAMAGFLGEGGGVTVTMSTGQWDALLQGAYDTGARLLELDADEQPVAAYRKGGVS
jgi:hypothetical protein